VIVKAIMQGAGRLMLRLGRDQCGAALVEYTLLIGLMIVALIGTINSIGNRIVVAWTSLDSAMEASAAPAGDPTAPAGPGNSHGNGQGNGNGRENGAGNGKGLGDTNSHK
jgi:pilus assembly protein Flp/PilA